MKALRTPVTPAEEASRRKRVTRPGFTRFTTPVFGQIPAVIFQSTISATTAVIDVGTTYTWSSPGLIADVQSWVASPAANFGWVIRADEVTQGTAVRFGSRENTMIPPVLTITYDAPPPTPSPTPTATLTPTPSPTPGTPTANTNASNRHANPDTNTNSNSVDHPPTPTPSSTPTPIPAPAQALNISTRMRVETGSNVLIAGFIIAGTAPENVILRGIGPSLSAVGISDPLNDPTLQLFDASGTLLIANDNWQDDPTQAALLTAAGLAPTNPNESGIYAPLQPASYTVALAGKNETTGVGLVEVYNTTHDNASQLGNISTRGFVLTGSDVMIGGFILGGGGNTHIVVRGIGPSLAQFGLSPVLPDPTLQLRDSDGTLLVFNDDWQDDPATASQLNFLGLALSDPKESGIYTSLPPGSFTAILAGANDGTGIGLVEIYNVH